MSIPELSKKQRERKVKDSAPQRMLFSELQRLLPTHDIRYNFPVRTKTFKRHISYWNVRYIDIADLTTMTAYEYDGKKWHRKPNKKRDLELKRAGWKVIHITKRNIRKILNTIICERDVSKVGSVGETRDESS